MKSKQLYPKSVRPLTTNSMTNSVNKQRVRCSLCDSLLKASTSHRYLLTGKSAHDYLDKDISYGECCKLFLNGAYEAEKLQMICPKCCHSLQRVYSLHKDAEQLTENIRHTWYKTKRLNRARHSRLTLAQMNEDISISPRPTVATDENQNITIKEELNIEEVPATSMEQSPLTISETVAEDIPYDLSNNQRIPKNIYPLKIPHHTIDNKQELTIGTKVKSRVQHQDQSLAKTTNGNKHVSRKSHPSKPYTPVSSTKNSRSKLPNGNGYFSNVTYPLVMNNQLTSPYAQLMIGSSSSSSSSSSHQQQQPNVRLRSSSDSEQPSIAATNDEPSMDGDQSLSPNTNDDEGSLTNEPKPTRLSRRQYDFLVTLPDQQSLNAFIETSSAESGSRWTWRRTSANSRGYKVYYVCNFSMRRHYHPCPAAMYALFHPEGSISIYSCGQHQHIPKDRLPVSITDATKDEIFKCLQAGMATTDIRDHLTRLHLPFGDARKLNNFIKYHKELLRFGTVTNVRIGGTAYRQPQCWAIRRQPPPPPSPLALTSSNDNTTSSTP